MVNMNIAEPVIDIRKDDILNTQIFENSLPIEYNFSICNYKDDKINEVEFEYEIEINLSNEDFPVNYKLYDCNSDKYVSLIDGKSEIMDLKANEKECRKFILYFEWKELEEFLSDEVKVDLKVSAVQKKE